MLIVFCLFCFNITKKAVEINETDISKIISWMVYDYKCNKYFEYGQYKNAAICYKEALQTHKDNVKFNYHLGYSMYELKNYTAGVYYFNKVLLSKRNAPYGLKSYKYLADCEKQIKLQKSDSDYLYALIKPLMWDKMPLKVWIQPSNLVINLESVLYAWQKPLEPMLKFEITNSKDEADITVQFISEKEIEKICDKVEKVENSMITGCTRPEYIGNTIIKADIYLNYYDKENSQFTNRIIYSTLTHEIGHAIGIMGHSDSEYDIMNGYATRYNYFINPTKRDLNTAAKLYSR